MALPKKNQRLVVYPADVVKITGRKPRTARYLLQKIRMIHGKDPGEFVTVKEFCDHTGMDEESVQQSLES